jgi:hypothetical protein
MFIFFDEIPREKREIFSKQNKMSVTQILLIHFSFVALLFLVLQAWSHALLYLPSWLTDVHDLGEGYTSIADLLFFIGALLLIAGEKAWLTRGISESENVQE